MGNYDVKWHAYEQAMKNDPAWQRLSKDKKAEQFGRYALGLQQDEIKAAKKAAGKKRAAEIASTKAAKKAPKAYQPPVFQQGSGNFSGHYTTVTPDNHAARQADLDAVFGLKKPHTTFQPGGGITPADGTLNVGRTTDPVLQGMNDRYRFLEERSNYKRALGEHLHKPTKVTADIIDQRLGIGQTSPQTEFYRALEQSQNTNKFKLGKWGKVALIAAGVALVASLGIWAAKKIKENKEEKLQEQQEQQPVETTPIEDGQNTANDTTIVIPPVGQDSTGVVPPVVEEPQDTTEVVPPVAGETEEDKAEETDKADKTDNDDNATLKIDGKKYTVKKGDNVWNIAKRHLREELGREPKLSEIKAKEQEIMKENNLKFEADGYVCIIKPEQELKVA